MPETTDQTDTLETPPQVEAPETPPQAESTEPAIKLNKDGSVPKKRGRKPGTGKSTPEQIEAGGATEKPQKRTSKVSFDVKAMGKQLVGLHALAYAATGIPECAINDQEGEMLAGGVAAVCEQYNLAISGKTGAMLQLFAAAAMVYGPRYVSLQRRMAQARKAHDENRTVDGESRVVQ